MPGRPQFENPYWEPSGRYEFRVWGNDLAHLFARLREASALEEIEDGTESYIVSSLGSPFNTKIRSGQLDIKRLIKTYKRLELWRPYLKKQFPLSRHTMREEVRSILSLNWQGAWPSSYALDPFIAEVIESSPHLTLVPLHKTRYRFTIESCAAEFTDVTVGGVRLETVAVESERVAAVLRAVTRLGLWRLENRNYQRVLRTILELGGMTRVNFSA